MRRVEPEWLDQLTPDDPRALRGRRDLIRVNAWMLQTRIMARSLLNHAGRKPRVILDIGAGDGAFMLRVAGRLARHWSDVTIILLDQQEIVSEETRKKFNALGWRAETVRQDVFRFLEQTTPVNIDVVTANLFLHHFMQEQLARLLAPVAQRTPLLVACEPRRTAPGLVASQLLWTIGCSDVTRHDAAVSVRAGFRGDELSELWSIRAGWEMREYGAGLFTHCFVARRISGEIA